MRSSTLGLLIAVGAFAASTIYLTLQLHEERARAAEVLDQTRALNARIAELQRTGAHMAPPNSLAADAAPTGRSLEPATAAEPPEPAEARRGFPPGPRSEAMQKMFRAQMRANFKRLYADLGKQLRLSKEQTDQLLDLLVEQQASLFSRGRPPNDFTAAEWQEQQQKNLTEVSALIGADKLQTFEAYQESLPARQEVEMLSRQLEANEAALSEDQRDRLVTALVEERRRIPMPLQSDSVSTEAYQQALVSWQEDYNERTAARANSILNSTQQAAYNDYRQWTRELRQQFQGRRGGPGGSPGFPPPPGP